MFADYVKEKREALRVGNRHYTLRQVAARTGIEPSYLSKIERGEFAPPSEEKIRLLAAELGEDPDVLLGPWPAKSPRTCKPLSAPGPGCSRT